MAASSPATSAGFSEPPASVLTSLSLRDVVLIERLDLALGAGLTVLTGETGAGKSILLDGLGLALGGRAEAGLVRHGAEQAVATACFTPPANHPVAGLLVEHGLDAADELVLRRVLNRDGRSRALVNDQPVGVALLRRIGAMLVEVEGQHDQQGLADAATHRAVLDAFAGHPDALTTTAATWTLWRDSESALAAARSEIAAAARDEEWLLHQVDELQQLDPQPGEEETLADTRQTLQHGERRAHRGCRRAGRTRPARPPLLRPRLRVARRRPCARSPRAPPHRCTQPRPVRPGRAGSRRAGPCRSRNPAPHHGRSGRR